MNISPELKALVQAAFGMVFGLFLVAILELNTAIAFMAGWGIGWLGCLWVWAHLEKDQDSKE